MHGDLYSRKKLFWVAMLALLWTMTSSFSAQARSSMHLSLTDVGAANNYAVVTYHGDNLRTGQDLYESTLTTSNVNARSFGKKVSYPVDGAVYAQPLFVPQVSIAGSIYNVVYVATEDDSVYAFNADASKVVAPLWKASFIHPPTSTAVPASKIKNGKDFVGTVGITGTPVIDIATGTLYVVAMTVESGTILQKLHALDITTGQDRPGSPVVIQGSVPGSGAGSLNHQVKVNTQIQNQRAALLLDHGVIYGAWASFGDTGPYHGWLVGLTYDGHAFQIVPNGVYNDTANGSQGGIWMGGGGPAADSSGNVYVATGNGTFDLNQGGIDAGDSLVKLSAANGLILNDYFAPFNQRCLQARDSDLGSADPLLLPDQLGANPHLLLASGKEGRIYTINRDSMGKYTADPHLVCQKAEERRTNVDHVLQELPVKTVGEFFGSMAYWAGTASSGARVYAGGFKAPLKAFKLAGGLLSAKPVNQTNTRFAFSGATPTISSNGNVAGSGIVWVTDSTNCKVTGCNPTGPGLLRAYDATNLAHELYSSGQTGARDRLDSYVKFSVPTVAEGHVFVGTQHSLTIFGLQH